ncbi:MAG: AAA family ATPase [Planctomycetota bacterium]
MIRRTIRRQILDRLKTYPAVGLVGPRQSGKTTLARSMKGVYFDLEQEPERLRLDLELDAVASGNRLVILDEAQSWPDVFPRLRGAIDAERGRKGRFLLWQAASPSSN